MEIPPILKKAWDSWKKIAEKIAAFQTRLILTILYIAVLGPIAMLLKLFMRDLLGKKLPKHQTSCWHEISFRNDTLESCQRQF